MQRRRRGSRGRRRKERKSWEKFSQKG